jgi:predicted O-methyltransferase YrrM
MEGTTRSLRTAARGLARRLWAFKVPVGAAIAVLAASLVVQQVAPSAAVLVAVALGVLVVLVEQRRQHAWIDGRFEEVVSDVAQIQPLLELEARLQPRRPLPPLRGYAIAPDFALMLTVLIAEEQPELVVETGSGVSTLVIAYALEKLGRGRVVALELDAGYAAKTRDEIERHGLSAYATVVHAPLAPIEIDGKRYTWHSLSALEGLDRIDLVVDDSPPRYLGEMLRYASLPTFAERLSRRGLFVLDFVAGEERETLARWKRRHPEFAQEHLDTKKGNVILRRAPAAAPAPLTVSPLEEPKPQMP